MSTQLAKSSARQSHKLVLEIDEGRFKTFFLNEAQAEFLAKGLNGPDRFIVLSKDVDPDAPTAYPKKYAKLTRMTDADHEARERRYTQSIRTAEDEAAEEQKRKDQATVREWVESHAAEFDAMKQKAKAELEASPGMYHAAGTTTKAYLEHYRAVRAVYKLLFGR